VASLIRALFVMALLAVPLLVITSLPRFFELAGSIPAAATTAIEPSPTPTFGLVDTTPYVPQSRFASLDATPPPTLQPPAATATAAPTAPPTPTGERIVIGNTGGQGAVLRSDPVTGQPVATLHEQQVLDVLEHRNVPGNGDWIHVRTSDGVEGWVTGRVASPAPAGTR
jgi:hypothetical protein